MTTDGWPDIAGRIVDGAHRLPVRVYYEDTDFLGAVYHANYLKFCERGRSDCLRLLGVHHHELQQGPAGERLGFVVRRMVCDFLSPARIDDLLEVVTMLGEAAGARMELRQWVKRSEAILFRADVTVALVDAAGRPRRLPSALRDAVLSGTPVR
jgi:acyl-CoA thioester hydrolase